MSKSIADYKEIFKKKEKEKEKLNINKNYLIKNDNIQESKEGILYNNGYFTKNDPNNLYVNFDPL